MRSHCRAIAVAFALAAATPLLVFAQSGSTQGNNPIARGDDVFISPINRSSPQTFGRGALDNTGIGRPNPRGQAQVTPVPEPSQWAMMLAGLALVGFIVRRSSRNQQ